MNQKYHVKLREAERVRLQEEKEATGTPKSIQRRYSILLMADENAGSIASQKEIGKRCGVSGTTVGELIRQYDTQGLYYCLRRRQHEKPPRPSIITGEKEARIIARHVAKRRKYIADGRYGCYKIRLQSCKSWIQLAERPSAVC